MHSAPHSVVSIHTACLPRCIRSDYFHHVKVYSRAHFMLMIYLYRTLNTYPHDPYTQIRNACQWR